MRTRRTYALIVLGACAVPSCGPTREVLDEQDRRASKAYQQRSVVPPKKGRLAEIHQKRLKFEYGGERPDSSAATPPKSSPGR